MTNQNLSVRIGEGDADETLLSPKLKIILSYLKTITAQVDVEKINGIFREHLLTRDELKSFVSFSNEKYQRNLISSSVWYDLLCLCWENGQASAIHDHVGSACAFQIVDGVATEVVYRKTGRFDSGQPLVAPVSRRDYQPGEVCASTETHIHRISNDQSDSRQLITLHLYSPPLRMTNYCLDPLSGSRLNARTS